ncbi:hypothetical protein SapgrDRAFT_0933 [Saprospira grandis DSM 2844]|uniref:Uncharacterized protein n=1 Tax=Saprospira grandis DSM 2844 TaxID=694433 RepID=J0P5G1_9BACT|nr:hypothetical protein [Saprospira grandis]EJF52662.1 hypothetical protein SapgrDRAFT_0933 [Saprospira grandis DSM 2844]
MAQKPIQIFRETPPHKSMDFFFLKEEGLQMVQELSGKVWTDYNTHDPGVTILEQLCYALADLGFRTDFSIQDLLNARGKGRRQALNNTFYDASEILPTNPVTIEDYRRLIIDRVNGVKNAWVEPVRDHLQGIKGLYRILLQVSDSARQPQRLQAIKREVYALFAAHRNLCEDLEAIEVLDVDKIIIYTDLDISSDVVAEEVLAEILFKLEEHLTPSIQYHTIDELLEEGYAIEEIFDGPVPVHGIIKKEDLKAMKREVYISKIIEIISDIEGVRRINYFRVEKDGFPVEGDVIRIAEKTYPVLDMDTIDARWKTDAYPIRFQRGSLNYDLDLNTASQLLYSLYARYKKGYQMKMLYNEKDYPSVLKEDDIKRYYSVQNTFPVTYGLSPFGLPNSVRPTRERLGMIKQLRGYLSFFEQMMANYLAQLGNVKKFFSLDSDLDRSYFSQLPENMPEMQYILKGKDNEARLKKLEETVAEFDPFVERRNRLLDHLLARFGERFTTDFLLKVSQYVGYDMSEGEAKSPEHELVNAKLEFLRNYVDISRNRSRGFNYMALYNVIYEQELEWAELFEPLIKQYKEEAERDLIRQQYKQLRENYPLRQHQRDAFSMALNYRDPADVAKEQTKKMLKDLDLPETLTEAIAETNLKFTKKMLELLETEVAGLERRVCLLLNLNQGGNESLVRIFDEETHLEEVDNFHDLIQLESPMLPEGYIDLDVELERLEKIEKGEDPGPAPERLPETLDYRSKFIFRAQDMDELIQDLLANGIFSYNYLALLEERDGEEIYSVYYKGNLDLGCVKIREYSSILAAQVELEKLIKFFARINHQTEGMHVVEHILLRPQAQDRHAFRLVNDQDRPLLESYEFGAFDEQRNLSNQLDLLASKKDNFIIETLEDGESYQVVLQEYNRKIARCPEIFYTQEGAKEQIDDIVAYVYSFKSGAIPLQSNIQFFLEERPNLDVRHDFYSLDMSIILPAWPSRFQNEDFQDLMHAVFTINAPAHININFYYLDINEMKAFEEKYFAWLEERNAVEAQQPELDNMAMEVVAELQKLEQN